MTENSEPDRHTELEARIKSEFPNVSAWRAEDLADRLEGEQHAEQNVLGILQAAQPDVNDATIELLTEQMDAAYARTAIMDEDPDLRFTDANIGYCHEEGFDPIRTIVLTHACRALKTQPPDDVKRQIELMEPWIYAADAMALKPSLQNWEDCQRESTCWNDYMLGKGDPTDTARMLGHQDSTFSAWNAMIETRHLGNVIIVAILNEEDLIRETIELEPDFYRRYFKECRNNRARPFAIVEDRTGSTLGICLLRFRKGKWYLAIPTSMQILSIGARNPDQLEKQLKAFAKDYEEASKKSAKGNPHRSWNYRPGDMEPYRKTSSTCSRCDTPTANQPKTPRDAKGKHPAVHCTSCRAEMQEHLDERRHRREANTQALRSVRPDIPAQPASPETHQGRCDACGELRPTRVIKLPSPAWNDEEANICELCAAIALEFPQTIRKPAHAKGRETVTITACTGCHNLVAKPNQDVPTPLCAQCTDHTKRMIIKALQHRGERTAQNEARMVERHPNHRCARCEPRERSEGTSPNTTPARCVPCREEYRQRTWQGDQASKRTCGCCSGDHATIKATAGHRRHTYICAICAKIGNEYDIFTFRNDQPITRNDHRNNQSHETRGQRWEAWQQRQAKVSYLYEELEAKKKGLVATKPAGIEDLLRSDSATTRADAKPERLNPELSRELCREYTEEDREIPELALRFKVSAQVVKNTLLGRSWKNQTEGLRPKSLRPEPRRVRLNQDPKAAAPVKEKPPKPAHITVSRLKGELGWTDKLIRKHLGEHDQEAPNPHYRSAAPMRLYRLDRVHQTMGEKAQLRTQLQQVLDNREKHKNEAAERTLKRREELLNRVAKLTPTMRRLPTRDANTLMDMATRARKKFLEENLWEHDYDIPVNDGSEIAEERAVSMVRHEFTNYEELLAEMPHSRDLETNAIIYATVKSKTLDLIAQAIPQLSEVCQRQIAILQKQTQP